MADIGWRTINGARVYLGGKGEVLAGPSKLMGSVLYTPKSDRIKKDTSKPEDIDSETIPRSGYDVPSKYFTFKDHKKGGYTHTPLTIKPTKEGSEYIHAQVRKDPTKASNPSVVKAAFESDFRKFGLEDWSQQRAANQIKNGESFMRAVQDALSFQNSVKKGHR